MATALRWDQTCSRHCPPVHADHPISRLIAGSHRGVTATFGAEWTLVGSRYPTDRGQISNVGQETEGQAFWKLVFKLDPKLTKSRSSWKCFARVYRGFIINLLLKPAVMMRRAGVQAIVGSGVAWVSLQRGWWWGRRRFYRGDGGAMQKNQPS